MRLAAKPSGGVFFLQRFDRPFNFNTSLCGCQGKGNIHRLRYSLLEIVSKTALFWGSFLVVNICGG
jgi:hypothetical protein